MIHFLLVVLVLVVFVLPILLLVLTSDWFAALCKGIGSCVEFLLKCGCWILIITFALTVAAFIIDVILKCNDYAPIFGTL